MSRCWLCLLVFLSQTAIKPAPAYQPCAMDSVRQKARAAELQAIERADQADRAGGTMRPGTAERDAERRARVGAILGEGCIRSGADYLAAALVYQHGGDTNFDPQVGAALALAPEHSFLAFYLAQRALELGEAKAKWLVAAAVDRYLIGVGKKQVFGTQFFKSMNDKCFCIMPIEASFSDARRSEYTGKNLQQAMEHLRSLPGQPADCKPAYCDAKLAPAPAGSLPGFW